MKEIATLIAVSLPGEIKDVQDLFNFAIKSFQAHYVLLWIVDMCLLLQLCQAPLPPLVEVN